MTVYDWIKQMGTEQFMMYLGTHYKTDIKRLDKSVDDISIEDLAKYILDQDADYLDTCCPAESYCINRRLNKDLDDYIQTPFSDLTCYEIVQEWLKQDCSLMHDYILHKGLVS